jgi:hypothetical protein
MNDRDLEGVRRAAESGDTRWAAGRFGIAAWTLSNGAIAFAQHRRLKLTQHFRVR